MVRLVGSLCLGLAVAAVTESYLNARGQRVVLDTWAKSLDADLSRSGWFQ